MSAELQSGVRSFGALLFSRGTIDNSALSTSKYRRNNFALFYRKGRQMFEEISVFNLITTLQNAHR